MNNVCPGSRWLCGRLWMGGRLQDPDAKRLQCHRRPKILRCRWKTTWRTPSELWQQRTALRFSLATPTVSE